jgi:hypothetical protein
LAHALSRGFWFSFRSKTLFIEKDDNMKFRSCSVLSVALAFAAVGCSSKVETTEDSTRVEAEGPKVEIGDKPVDLDPSTDDDIDVDTPAPGDR